MESEKICSFDLNLLPQKLYNALDGIIEGADYYEQEGSFDPLLTASIEAQEALIATINCLKLIRYQNVGDELWNPDDDNIVKPAGMYILTNEDMNKPSADDISTGDVGEFVNKTEGTEIKIESMKIRAKGVTDSMGTVTAVIESIKKNEDIKNATEQAVKSMLTFLLNMPDPSVDETFVLNSASRIFGKKRLSLLANFYLLYMQVCCARSIYWPGASPEVLNELGFPGGIPSTYNSLNMVRTVQRQLCLNMNYRSGTLATSINALVIEASISLFINMDISTIPPADLHEVVHRCMFFQISVMRSIIWAQQEDWVNARYPLPPDDGSEEKMDDDDRIFQRSELIKFMCTMAGNFDMNFNRKRQYVDMMSLLMRCQGEGYLAAEQFPFMEQNSVVTLDNTSITKYRFLTKLVDRTYPVDMINNPNILREGICEGPRDPNAYRTILCMVYLFLFDFSVSPGMEGPTYLMDFVRIFPNTFDNLKPGCVQIVGGNFYVSDGSSFIDFNNDPNLLIDLVVTHIMRTNSFRGELNKLIMEFNAAQLTDVVEIPKDYNVDILFD